MVVDDQEAIRDLLGRITKKIIRSHNSFIKTELIEAGGSEQGWKKFQSNPHIALVITDRQMPKENGIQMLNRIKEKQPKQKCLLLSGNFDEADRKDLLDLTSKEVKLMSKPFELPAITECIKSLLFD